MADLTIITLIIHGDEDPQAIIDDIKIGMAKTDGKYVEIPDRKELLPMRSIMENREISLSSQEKDMRITRRSRVRKYPMDERVLIREILEEDRKA